MTISYSIYIYIYIYIHVYNDACVGYVGTDSLLVILTGACSRDDRQDSNARDSSVCEEE
jgi:hypothetical protein